MMGEICCQCNKPKGNAENCSTSNKLKKICRLCLLPSNGMEPIFMFKGDNSLSEKIYACTSVQIDKHNQEGTPVSICESCKTTLYRCYQFREVCLKNDLILRNLCNVLDEDQSGKDEDDDGGIDKTLRNGKVCAAAETENLRIVIRSETNKRKKKRKVKRLKHIKKGAKPSAEGVEVSTCTSDSCSDNEKEKERDSVESRKSELSDDELIERLIYHDSDANEQPPPQSPSPPLPPIPIIHYTNNNNIDTTNNNTSDIPAQAVIIPMDKWMASIPKEDILPKPRRGRPRKSRSVDKNENKKENQVKVNVEPNSPEDPSKQIKKSANCEFCGVDMVNLTNLKKHFYDIHPNKVHMVQCEICRKTFSSTKLQEIHIMINHSEKYDCVPCNRVFNNYRAFYQHQRTLTHKINMGENVQRRRRYVDPNQAPAMPKRRKSVHEIGEEVKKFPKISQRRKSMHVLSSYEPTPLFDLYQCRLDPTRVFRCDYCDVTFDDEISLARHVALRPCDVVVEPLHMKTDSNEEEFEEVVVAPDILIHLPEITKTSIVDLT